MFNWDYGITCNTNKSLSWRISTVVLKNSPSRLFKRNVPLEFSYSDGMAWTSPSFMLKFLMTCHRPACQTMSNAFLESKKLSNRSRWCRCFSVMNYLLKVCSTVLQPGLKPACSSASSSSALALSRLRTPRSIILLGWLIRLMVRWFWHCLRLPFFGKSMTSDCVYVFRHHVRVLFR